MTRDGYKYVGNELDLFAHATNWKRYLSKKLKRFIKGRILEVGAGMGSTTRFLGGSSLDRWTCLEPDPELAALLQAFYLQLPSTNRPEVIIGRLADLAPERTFDCILYVDVLEHILDDAGELTKAAGHLSPKGYMLVLSPAYQRLYSPFDRSIGHYRRYDRKTLTALTPEGLTPIKILYLGSADLLAVIVNRHLFKQGLPNSFQIRLWDRLLVPVSRVLDPIFGHTFGKSILAVWYKAY